MTGLASAKSHYCPRPGSIGLSSFAILSSREAMTGVFWAEEVELCEDGVEEDADGADELELF